MKIVQLPDFLDDNGEADSGCVVIESTVDELAQAKAGTVCGDIGNQTFEALAQKGFANREVVGWYDPQEHVVWGMFHIQATQKEARTIERIAEKVEGSLRFNGPSAKPGFMEFEIE